MILNDLHIHTKYSFDGYDPLEDLCTAAVKRGLDTIAITDHCDYDGVAEGLYTMFEWETVRNQVYEAKEKFKGRLNILWGIEIGQPHVMHDEVMDFIKEGRYEYVLGALHNLERVPDFYYFKYDRMDNRERSYWWRRSVYETLKMVDAGGFDTLAHFTYPIRYLYMSGCTIELEKFFPEIEEVFRLMIKKDIALEVNTSGIRGGLGFTLPADDLISLYASCGGKKIAVGSDAHRASDVGADIEKITQNLRESGFEIINPAGQT